MSTSSSEDDGYKDEDRLHDQLSCEWDFHYVSCCKNIWKLYEASNGKIYCMTHFRVIEYVLYTSGDTSKMKAPNAAKSKVVKPLTTDPKAGSSPSTTGRLDAEDQTPKKGVAKPSPKAKTPKIKERSLPSSKVSEKKWAPIADKDIPRELDPNFPPITPELKTEPSVPEPVVPAKAESTLVVIPVVSPAVETKEGGKKMVSIPPTPGPVDQGSQDNINMISKIYNLGPFLIKENPRESDTTRSRESRLSDSNLAQPEWTPIRTAKSGPSSLNTSSSSSGGLDVPMDAQARGSPGGSPGVGRRECNAKGCLEVNIKHIYQGYFCSRHEAIIKGYRSVIELNKKDPRELAARIAEQDLRKIPHPLYQRDIDILKHSTKKAEADFINRVFTY
jgi:hypothetical protein